MVATPPPNPIFIQNFSFNLKVMNPKFRSRIKPTQSNLVFKLHKHSRELATKIKLESNKEILEGIFLLS